MRNRAGAAALLVTTMLAGTMGAGAALAQDFTGLRVFGDSLSDPGNIPGLTGENFPPSPPYNTNHFSNGPTFAEQLPALIGVAPGSVTNLAVGGAFTRDLPDPTAADGLNGNLNTFRFFATNPGLVALENTDITRQVNGFIAANTVRASDLFMVYGGANNAFFALNPLALPADPTAAGLSVITAATQSGQDTAASAQALVNAGARTIILPTLPNLALTPNVLALNNAGASALSALFSSTHNTTLVQGAQGLAARTGADVVIVDLATLTADAVANPAKYGLTNVTGSCIGLANCDGFLFFDDVHPTTAVHAVSAAFVAATIVGPMSIAPQAETGRFAAEDFGRSLTQAAVMGGTWFTVDVSYSDWSRDKAPGTTGYDSDVSRLTAMGSYEVGDGVSLGVALGFDMGSADLDNGGSFDFDAIRLGAFAGFGGSGPGLYGGLSLAFSMDNYDDITRPTGVAGQIARADAEGDSFSAIGEAGYRFALTQHYTLAPMVRAGFARGDVEGYSETGATGLNLSVQDNDSSQSFAEVGLRFDGAIETGGAVIMPSLSVVYHTGINDDTQEIVTSLVSVPGASRRTNVGAPDDSYVRVDVGLDAVLEGGVVLGLSGNATLGGDEIDGFGVRGRIGYAF